MSVRGGFCVQHAADGSEGEPNKPLIHPYGIAAERDHCRIREEPGVGVIKPGELHPE